METIEESIERGLDAELNYTEEITGAVVALVATLPSPGDAHLLKREIKCAHETLKDLKEASIQFMKIFHQASLGLNESTNEVKLAEARIAGSGKDVVDVLAKEKVAADKETDKELQERVGVVEGDFETVDRSIESALRGLEEVEDGGGVAIGRVASPAGMAGMGQAPQQAQGMMSALERARMRNADGGNRIPYE